MDKVVHFEIPADDIAKAKKFYEDVLGWMMMDVPGMDYAIITTVEADENQMPKEAWAINGGMLKRSDVAKVPSIVVDVASVDDSIAKIEKAGGRVIEAKHQVGDMGINAKIEDPEGNVIGLWQNIKN